MFDTLWVSQAERRLALTNNPESVQSESKTRLSTNGSESKSRPRPFKSHLETKTSLKDYNTTSGIYCAWLQHSVLARSDTSTPSNPGVTCPPVCSVVTTALRWKVELHRLGCWRIPRGRRPATSSCSSSRMCAFFFSLYAALSVSDWRFVCFIVNLTSEGPTDLPANRSWCG